MESKLQRESQTMLWKTQLLDLINEAPKPNCIECLEINPNHKLLFNQSHNNNNYCPSTISGSEESDFSGLSSSHELLEDQGKINVVNLTLQEDKKVKGKEGKEKVKESMSIPVLTGGESRRQQGGRSVAAPWNRPSIYYYNPFGSSFHGSLNITNVKRLLVNDGDFLVRKRIEDNDDEFVLSFRFNGHLKNFLVTFDDTSGLIFLGGRKEKDNKGFDTLEELVQQGLTTMYLEHKAGPYIDLLYDLTRNENNKKDNLPIAVKGMGTGTFTMDCIYEFFDKSGNGSVRMSSSKQNSPSPMSSISGSSLERAIRHPDLKSHAFQLHTFQELSKCHVCKNFLWGLSSQGLLCQHCELIVHESCIDKVSQDCEPNLNRLPSIFGVSLTHLVKGTKGHKAPFLLQKCISEIDQRGLHIEGLYRISGSREGSERLKTVLENERESADIRTHSDIHSMCSLIKQFLRKLPEPLITEDIFQSFLNGSVNVNLNNLGHNGFNNGSSTSSSPRLDGPPSQTPKSPTPIAVDSVRRELKKLPPAHYITLKFLLQHLHRVAEQSEDNKMNPHNLSSIFAPSLLHESQISIDTLQTATVLLELMITQVRNLFPK